MEDQAVEVVCQICKRELCLRPGNTDGADEQAIVVLLVREDTVVIRNPPYKEKAKGKGAWVENGSPAKQKREDIPLNSWQPPKDWKVGAHAKHLDTSKNPRL